MKTLNDKMGLLTDVALRKAKMAVNALAICSKRAVLLEILSLILLCNGTFGKKPTAKEEALLAIKQANTRLSTQLYDVIRKDKDNLVVSPWSVSHVAAMLHSGAREDTATAIRSTFHFPPEEQLNLGYQTLIEQLRKDGGPALKMVNIIYLAEGYTVNPEFGDLFKNLSGMELQQLNYAKNAEAAREINSFVSVATQSKIPDFIEAKDLNEQTRLVLINAIYFKGLWRRQFPKKDTAKMEFYTSETANSSVYMMQTVADLLYGEIPELNAQVVSLPYRSGYCHMLVLLPNKRTGLAEMEDKLKFFPLDKIIKGMWWRKVQLFLPKFKLESTINLESLLTKLGVGVMFDQAKANFSGIPAEQLNESESIYVSKAIQKVYVEVNEEGAEAPPPTVTGMMQRAKKKLTHPEPQPVVRVDHPFYSMIVHGDMTRMHSELTTPIMVQRVVHIEMGH